MEDDTLKKAASGQKADLRESAPLHSPTKVYDGFHSRPENANLIPGGTTNTAGGRSKEFGVIDAARTIKLEDFQEFHKKPCVRDSLLTGIGSGFAIGGVTAMFGKPISSAANFAVGTFCAMSFGMYQFCLIRRQMEKDGMRRAVEVMDRKRAENRAKMEEQKRAKEEADRVAEEERKKIAEQQSKWWKIW